ncbi:hypothetical protein POM88_028421 [Heracleum sosnowskyi]|uniref:Helitron helicase-like domain-containing protein n=1 Tax=Heracleum sosnowskyi TaxID=360622 RepID=A0AAD8MHK9_9APIA|nr:hypothetical protein POM88_028421 [Heracleum sosnowskyi]
MIRPNEGLTMRLGGHVKKKNFFGRCAAVMYVIEYQKRGLPHVHMLIWLHPADKATFSTNVDTFVSAEIPAENTDPYGHQAVKTFMMHGPCGADFPHSPCMDNYICTKQFPKKYCQGTMTAEVRLSKLEAFFSLNQSNQFARTLTYQEIPKHFVWNSNSTSWTPRVCSDHIGRIRTTHHSSGELWYLRLLLTKVRGPTSFRALRTINGIIYNTFQEACAQYGFLSSDNEWHQAIEENKEFAMPRQLRLLFVYIIVNCQVKDVLQLWRSHWRCLCEDVVYQQRRLTRNNDLQLSDNQMEFYGLAEIEKLLGAIGKSLNKFPTFTRTRVTTQRRDCGHVDEKFKSNIGSLQWYTFNSSKMHETYSAM